jgi:dimethylamine monooxygenase subunit A
MPFDFDAAVQSPFRMQPGLRRLAPGARQLSPLRPGSRHQREKLAVLSAFAQQALLCEPGFDPGAALDALCRHAQAEHPEAWAWCGGRAEALLLGTAVDADGAVATTRPGEFGLGDEVARCVAGLPSEWRLAGLLCLAFAEDFAVVDGERGTLPWLAVCLPSHWAPEDKVGRHFAEVHAPVADNALLVKASDSLTRLVTGTERWERFVWNITAHPRLHAHPSRMDPDPWRDTPVEHSWWRTEQQSFIPVDVASAGRQAMFVIHVQVQPLAAAIASPRHAHLLREAVATMSPAVLDYRGLASVREPLLAWLEAAALKNGPPGPS